MPLSEDATTRQLRRDENNARKEYRWMHQELMRVQSANADVKDKSKLQGHDHVVKPPRSGSDYLIGRAEENAEELYRDIMARYRQAGQELDSAAETAISTSTASATAKTSPNPSRGGDPRREERERKANQRRAQKQARKRNR